MLIEPDHIVTARSETGRQGNPQAMDDLAGREPALAAYIQEGLAAMAGKLTLSGAPTAVVQNAFNEALTLVLSSVEAQRRAHYDLWKGTTVGTLLEQLATGTKPRRRRKNDGEKNT
jgi:hypothetical protein